MDIKNYLLGIVAAAIICSVTKALLDGKSAIGRIVQILGGILLAVTILSPVLNISFRGITDYFDDLSADAKSFVDEGKNVSDESVRAIIKNRTEAYILDKANRMGLQIAVEVELDASNNSIPCGVVFKGSVSPYAKEILCGYVEDNLGITRENQKWM